MDIVKGGGDLNGSQSDMSTLKISLPKESEGGGYLGDGHLTLPSNVDKVGHEQEQNSIIPGKGTKQADKISVAKRKRVLWAALAATLSIAAVAFLVRQCSTGLQASHANVTSRRLAEAPESSPELQICEEVSIPKVGNQEKPWGGSLLNTANCICNREPLLSPEK
ncbi:hypothetical protein EPH_0010740 [Eimeria praecox]|uniref:Uncharacterized protein n=1 Tax=Eimeria praecox TaxID=51316 RepID=U6GT67_9EIME|nr:hypothetical protein EPH_0010740 [Eimeria praecox]